MFADFRQNIQFALRIRCKILPIEIQVRKFKSQFKFYLVLHVISHCKVYLMVNLVLWGIAVLYAVSRCICMTYRHKKSMAYRSKRCMTNRTLQVTRDCFTRHYETMFKTKDGSINVNESYALQLSSYFASYLTSYSLH